MIFFTLGGAAPVSVVRPSPPILEPRPDRSKCFTPLSCFAFRSLGELTSTPQSSPTRVSGRLRRMMFHRENSSFGRPFYTSQSKTASRPGERSATVAKLGVHISLISKSALAYSSLKFELYVAKLVSQHYSCLHIVTVSILSSR